MKRLHPFFIEKIKEVAIVSEVLADLSDRLPGFIEVYGNNSFAAYIHDGCYEYPSGCTDRLFESSDWLYGYFRDELHFVDKRLSVTWNKGVIKGNCLLLAMLSGMSFPESVLYLAAKYGLGKHLDDQRQEQRA